MYDMTVIELKRSGLLELYVLRIIASEGKEMIETMIAKFPTLRIEITEIELALERFAMINGIQPRNSRPTFNSILDIE